MLFNLFRQPYLNADTGTTTGATTETTTETQSTETTQQNTTTETQQTTEQPKIKVKYNHQDMELPYEEAVTHIQKGMNYDKAVERAKQESIQAGRDAWIAEQGFIWNDKPITTEAEYVQALKEKEIYDKYQEQGLPEEVIQKLAKVDQIEAQINNEKQTKEQQARQQAEYSEFFNYFKEKNGRDFDPDKDILSDEVWAEVKKGTPLKTAYAINRASQLEARITELEGKQKALETNQANSASSTGSVTGNGNAGADFISFETFEANKKDQNWINKNFNKIIESRTKW